MSTHNIMSISDMIHLSFGESTDNVVNFKLIQAVLYLLARQLRVLERRVEVKVGLVDPDATVIGSNLSVTEVKINAAVAKKKRKISQEATPKNTVKANSLTKAATSAVKEDGESSETSSNPSHKDTFQTLEAEMLREKELRVINQRADSHEEPDIEPLPMALVPSTEIVNEKILIIERKPSMVGTLKRGERSQESVHKLSIVTKQQFQKLEAGFEELRKECTGKLGLPENDEIINKLRKGASLMDAMSALKLSARLEAAEKSIAFLSGIVTEICREKEINITKDGKVSSTNRDIKKEIIMVKEKEIFNGTDAENKGEKLEGPETEQQTGQNVEDPNVIDQGISVVLKPKKTTPYPLEDGEYVTCKDLKFAMKNLEDQIIATVQNQNKQSEETSKKALKTSLKLEEQLGEAFALTSRMNQLNEMVSKYTSRISDIDMGISAQMSAYQDQLTQMQFDLESTIDSVAEAIASSGADPEIIKELRVKMNKLQQNLDLSLGDQKEMQRVLHTLAVDIETQWKEIENIRAAKVDHEELEDALHDKVDTSLINGMVAQDYFDACLNDFTKKIIDIYERCDGQEIQWQKVIDDFVKELNKKADFTQVKDLRDDIQVHLQFLRDQTKSLAVTTGIEQASAVSKCIVRDTDCLSCRRPATLNPEGTCVPKLQVFNRPQTIGAENVTESGDGLCHRGQPIPHQIDPRVKFCRRYCGGQMAGERLPLAKAVNTKHLVGEEIRQIGVDGKSYLVNESGMQPCFPCNKVLSEDHEILSAKEDRVPSKSKDSVGRWSGGFASKMDENSASSAIPFYEYNYD